MADGAKKNIKIWRVSKEASAGLMISHDTALLIGNETNFIAASPNGISISGPVNFMTTSENIRTAGLFVQQNDFIKMIPTTIVTPIPSQVPVPPVAFFAYIALFLPAMLELTNV